MSRWVLETECEHGFMECGEFICGHDHQDYQEAPAFESCWCPGGSRREVTVDYEAAARAVRHHWVEQELGPVDPFTPEEVELSVIVGREVLDAALAEAGDSL